MGIVAVQILFGIQPALLIYITQHLIDTVVASAGAGSAGLEQNLEHALGRRFLTKASRLPLVFFEVSASYDRLEAVELFRYI